MRKIIFLLFAASCGMYVSAQLKWTNVDSLYQPLTSSVHVYFTDQPIDTAVFRAYYLIADLKDKNLDFTVDTSLNRRLTPQKFYEKNEKPLVVVNCTFFSFETNRNLNVVIKNFKLLSYNVHSIKAGKGDSLKYYYPMRSALGISNKKKPDIVWVYTDSLRKYPIAFESPYKLKFGYDSSPNLRKIYRPYLNWKFGRYNGNTHLKWKPETAIGGGPALLVKGNIFITNEEERMFIGKAINDKHPRTAMGYTKYGKLIILVIQGRSESSGGASLPQEAQILRELGCVEALNLDGGGSSCMLVNGKETIKPSDKEGQRPVPAVFIIKQK
jgi:hypothetical protein